MGINTAVQNVNSVTLTLPLRPIAVQSVRTTKAGRQYQPTRIVKFKREVSREAKHQLGNKWQLLSGEVWVELEFDFALPKSAKTTLKHRVWKGNEKVAMLCRPDVDNCTKGVLDALNGIAWVDDCQVRKITATKNYAQTDGITITIHNKESYVDNSVKDEQALDIDGDLTFFQAVGLMHYGFFCKTVDSEDIYCIGNHKLCKVITPEDLKETTATQKIYNSTWKVIGYPGAKLNEILHKL